MNVLGCCILSYSLCRFKWPSASMPAALARFSPFAAYNIYRQLNYKIIYWSWQARDIKKIWFCHIIPQKAKILKWDEVLYVVVWPADVGLIFWEWFLITRTVVRRWSLVYWYFDQLMLNWFFESDELTTRGNN